MKETLSKLGRHFAGRILLLFLAVVVAVFLTIVIANMGGELDRIVEAGIRHEVGAGLMMDREFMRLPVEQQAEITEAHVQIALRQLGMDEPFFPHRSLMFVRQAMTLELGRARVITSDAHSYDVRDILLERLPFTLILFGTAELLLFSITLFFGLFLSRRYGSFLDKLIVALAPTSAPPGWFYGIFLIMIFAYILDWLPWGGVAPAGMHPSFTLEFAGQLLRHMVLPTAAIILNAVFAAIYGTRTFFLIFSMEDHVEMAKAKGLSPRAIERRHILRPTLPPIITNFLLLLITMWMGQIILEAVFDWPGLGQVFDEAIRAHETAVIVGFIVIFGYLLAATVFLLDLIYAMVDPRVRVGPAKQGR